MEEQHSQSESAVKNSKTLKRSREQGGNQKKRRIDRVPLKLVDINDDCLQSIFKYLSVDDLINVAEADDQLIPAAAEVFSRFHRKKQFDVVPEILRPSDDGCQKLLMDKAKNCLTHFGQHVSDLSIQFKDHREIEIERLIQKHCITSLRNLKLIFCEKNYFGAMRKPFVNVEKLAIVDSRLGLKMLHMNHWFPNLVSLELFHVNLNHPEITEVNFPQLKNLVVWDEFFELPSTVVTMVGHHPQLKSLKLRCDIDDHLLQSISEHLVQLEELTMWDQFTGFEDHKYRFETVTKFTLNEPLLGPGTPTGTVLLVFPNLSELTFNGFVYLNGSALNFLAECKNLSKLTCVPSIEYPNELFSEYPENIVWQLPKLVQVEFCGDDFEESDLIEMLSKGKTLQRVHCFFRRGAPEWWNSGWAAVEAEWVVLAHEHDYPIAECYSEDQEYLDVLNEIECDVCGQSHFCLSLKRK